MDFNVVKAALEDIGLSVFKMNYPVTLVGEGESAIRLVTRVNRYRDLNHVVNVFQGYYNDGLKSVYLYKVTKPFEDGADSLYRIRAAWHVDADGPNDDVSFG